MNILRNTLAAGAVLFATFGAVQAHALLLGFTPDFQVSAAGDIVLLDLFADDLAGDAIGAYDLDVAYDSSVLSLNSVSFSAALGSDAIAGAFDSPAGIIDIFAVSLLGLGELGVLQNPGPVVLATFEFTVAMLTQAASTVVGIDALDPFLLVANDPGDPFGFSDINLAAATIQVNVPPQPVPAPGGLAALVLLIAGLLLAGAMRRPGCTRV